MQDVKVLTPKEFHDALNGKIGFNSIYQALGDKSDKGIRNFRVGGKGGKILIPSTEIEAWPSRLVIGVK